MEKTDRELLELAAKAAGIVIYNWWPEPDFYSHRSGEVASTPEGEWNPLTDDGDALRLAVRLRLWIKDFSPVDYEEIVPSPGFVEIWREADEDPIWTEYYEPGADRYAATRRAIVRTAAAIGKSMASEIGRAVG